jgi:hypothetical protein
MLGAWYWPSRVFDEAPLVLLACAASPLLVWIPGSHKDQVQRRKSVELRDTNLVNNAFFMLPVVTSYKLCTYCST